MIYFRPLPVATIATLIAVVVLGVLGNWQMERLDWKNALVAAVQTRSEQSPVSLATVFDVAPDEREYMHVWARGVFDHANEAYLFSHLEDGRTGFQVLTPFELVDGRVILVDRGFVPPEMRAPETRRLNEPEGLQTISGLVRNEQLVETFTPAPSHAEKVWYSRDVADIAQVLGLEFAAPLVLTADATPGLDGFPEGGHTRLTFKNDHLSYALTWFSLAVVLLGVYSAFHISCGRLKFGGAQTQ